ncbi:MAG: hypothetical protein JRJ54_13085 [Deltaproteobacteria bacterium]|nr:hypothetical protein [Deltaproteobacteria bacterium]
MNLHDFFDGVVASVAEDAALAAWAESNFGKGVSVYMEIPSESFPDFDDDAPFIVIGSPWRRANQERRVVEYGMEAWLGIAKSTYATRADGATEPAGVELIIDMIETVKNAIAAGLPEGFTMALEEYTDSLAAHDYCEGFMVLDFSKQLTIGEDPFA